MIDKVFWQKILSNWKKNNDGIDIPDNIKKNAEDVKGIVDDEFLNFEDVSNEEIDSILADLGLDDI